MPGVFPAFFCDNDPFFYDGSPGLDILRGAKQPFGFVCENFLSYLNRLRTNCILKIIIVMDTLIQNNFIFDIHLRN
jgi:hypothetical protein